jgi:hypothetical protein
VTGGARVRLLDRLRAVNRGKDVLRRPLQPQLLVLMRFPETYRKRLD